MENKNKPGILREIFSSTGDGRTSISKIAMIVGLIVGSYVVIIQTYNNGISYDIFAIYMLCTLGANSVNKGIAMVQAIKESKYQHQYSTYSPPVEDQPLDQDRTKYDD